MRVHAMRAQAMRVHAMRAQAMRVHAMRAQAMRVHAMWCGVNQACPKGTGNDCVCPHAVSLFRQWSQWSSTAGPESKGHELLRGRFSWAAGAAAWSS